MNRVVQLAHQASACLAQLAYARAVPLLEEALGLLARSRAADLPLKLQLQHQLKEAYLFCGQGVSEELQADLLTDLIYTHNQAGALSPATLHLYDELAECYLRSRDFPSAIQTLEAALLLMDDLPDDTRPERLYIVTKLGMLHQEQADWATAAGCYTQAIQLQDETRAQPAPGLLHRLAECLQHTNDARTEGYFREAVAQQVALSGNPSLAAAERKARLAAYYAHVNRRVAAEQQYQEALAILENCPPSHRLNGVLPRYRLALATLLVARQELRLALEQLDLAAQHFEALSEQHGGARARLFHRRMAEVRLLQADYLFAAGEHTRALALYQELYNQFYDLTGHSLALARCLYRMGRAMASLDEPLEAERFFHDAEQLLNRLAGPATLPLAALRERVTAMPGA